MQSLKTKFSLAIAAASALAAGSAQAAFMYDAPTAPTLAKQWTIGQPGGGFTPAATPTVTSGAYYSNQTTFTGFGVNAGGAPASGAKFTRMLMDDINTNFAGNFTLGQFSWSAANLNSVAVSATMNIRFFAADGAAGAPGTFLGGINFNSTSLTAGSVNGFFFDATSAGIVLPQNFWAGEFFTGLSTVTQARFNNLGQGTFNPPDVGTSQDLDFLTTATATSTASFAGSGLAVGGTRTGGGGTNPVLSYEWEFNPTPEPASLGLMGVAVLGLASRRRRA